MGDFDDGNRADEAHPGEKPARVLLKRDIMLVPELHLKLVAGVYEKTNGMWERKGGGGIEGAARYNRLEEIYRERSRK